MTTSIAIPMKIEDVTGIIRPATLFVRINPKPLIKSTKITIDSRSVPKRLKVLRKRDCSDGIFLVTLYGYYLQKAAMRTVKCDI
jgi:hypothetical protein